MVHAELRRVCGGPAVAQASVTQLQARIELLRKRLSVAESARRRPVGYDAARSAGSPMPVSTPSLERRRGRARP